jgi:hypothetical protein
MAYGLKPVNKELMLWNNFHTIKYHWQLSNQYESEKRGPKFKYQKNELQKRLVLKKNPVLVSLLFYMIFYYDRRAR